MSDITEAGNGTFTITTTTISTIDCNGIYVGSDAVFADLEVNDTAVDIRTTYFDDAGGTIPAGTLIRPIFPATRFTKVQLTSGTVTLIK